MSKNYSLLVLFTLALFTLKTKAQTADSCSANFERVASTNASSLTIGFHAIPWHNHEKKPEQICWNFGDNHDTCIQYNPSLTSDFLVSHTYAATGNYNVCVKITYQGGCQSYSCKAISLGVADSCRAGFEVVSSTANALGEYFVAKVWQSNNKKPVSICWNFGDNHDTCIQYSTSFTGTYAAYHLYSHADNYNVCVKIQYDAGCLAQSCETIHVGATRDSCSSDFEVTASNSTATGRYFVAKPWDSQNKKPVSICWNFGDGHDTCIQYSTVNTAPYAVEHRYAEPGTYNVCVRIAYDGGCVSEKCKVITIGVPDTCYADFEKIPTPTSNNASFVYFRALPKNSNDRKPARICWSFGDGTDTCFSYGQDYSGSYIAGHRYDHAGVYQVCVSIYYYGGCEAKKCKAVEVFIYNADTCRVKLYEASPSVTSLTRGFYFQSSTNSRPARVCWSFGDGTDTCVGIEPNATEIPYSIKHTYPAPGDYNVCVKVLFANGCSAYNCIQVIIRSYTDACGGYFTDSLTDARTYLFKGFSVHKSDDAVVSFRWTFGDGSTGIGENVTHTYDKPGPYHVCLLINTERGCETRACNDVKIAGETPSRLQLTPNPVGDVLHVLFYSSRNENVTVKIVDANGIAVRSFSRAVTVGINTWDVQAGGLFPGIYSLSIQSANQSLSAIFFKQ